MSVCGTTKNAPQLQYVRWETKAKCVWVVDDNPAMRVLAESILRKEGIAVRSSEDVRSAMIDLEAMTADGVVVLDINLPDGTGFDILRRIREHSDAAVIVVSSMNQPHIIQQALAFGANEYLEKPFDPGTLVAYVKNYLSELPHGGAVEPRP